MLRTRHHLKFIIILIIQTLLVWGYLFLINFLPAPFNRINWLGIFMILYVVINIRREFIWSFLPIIWLQELFSALPFGFHTIALLLALFLVRFSLVTVFSSRSLLAVAFSSVLFLASYHLIIWLLQRIFAVFLSFDFLTSLNAEWFKKIGWEIILTTIIICLIYYILSLFMKRLSPDYIITSLQKEYESKKYFSSRN